MSELQFLHYRVDAWGETPEDIAQALRKAAERIENGLLSGGGWAADNPSASFAYDEIRKERAALMSCKNAAKKVNVNLQ